LSWPCLV